MLRGMRHVVRVGLATLAIAAAGSLPLSADTYPRQPGVSITHYAFDVVLSETSSEITVTEVVDLRFTASGVTAVDLDLCDVNPSRTPGAIVDPCVGARGAAPAPAARRPVRAAEACRDPRISPRRRPA